MPEWNSVRVAFTSNVALTGTPIGDSVQTAALDDVGVFGNTNGAENGIYTIPSGGGAWTRRTDANADAHFVPGKVVYVREGTEYGGWNWQLKNASTPTLGTSMLNFAATSRDDVETAEPGGGIQEQGGVFSLPNLGVTPGSYGTDTPFTLGTNGLVVDADGVTYGSQSYIKGLTLSRAGTHEILSSPGALWVPNGQRVYETTNTGVFLGPTGTTAIALWYCYWRLLGTTLAFDAYSTPPDNFSYVTSTNSSGARVISAAPLLGTTVDQYRYVGAALAAVGGAIYPFSTYGDENGLEIAYQTDTAVFPFRRITDGTATTPTDVDCSSIVPRGARQICLMVRNRSDKSCLLLLQDDNRVLATVPAGAAIPVWIRVNFTTRIFRYQIAATPAAGGVTLDVLGYRDWR